MYERKFTEIGNVGNWPGNDYLHTRLCNGLTDLDEIWNVHSS